MIVAIPAAVVVFLLMVALVLFGMRPDKKPDDTVASAGSAKSSPARKVEPAAPPPAPPQPVPAEPAPPVPPPAPVAPAVPKSAPPQVATQPTPLAAAPRPATPSPPAAPVTRPTQPPSSNAPSQIDLLASLDLNASTVSGTWRREGSVLRCTDASAQNRAKLRLSPPPPGSGYDIAITFTAEGERRFVAHVLSFRGKQFIFAMFSSQSGFASVRGQNALANETTRNKGITAGKKHTSVVKVREKEVSAYLDGELLSTHATDYSDLSVSDAWNLGPSSKRDNLLGVASESPITIEAITLTPLEAEPAKSPENSPAKPSMFATLAAMISSPFSTESSAAATQPAAGQRIGAGDLQSLVAASQPVVSDVAADLLKTLNPSAPAATGPAVTSSDARVRDPFFRAVQVSISPGAPHSDPLMETRPAEHGPTPQSRADFDADQARIAAWRTLAGGMSAFYPDAKPRRDLIKLQLTPAGGAAKGIPVSFSATHTHAEPLTNVTLAVEIVHAMTSPSPTAVHHYFIPRWMPAQKIFLPVVYQPNVPSSELLEYPAPWPASELSGLIEARVQAWSDQFRQAKESTSFDPRFQALARQQLNEAYRLVEEAVRGPAPASRPATGVARSPTLPPRRGNALIPGPVIAARPDLDEGAEALALARAAARRALRLLPQQSPLAEDARQVIAQPQVALRSFRERQLSEYIAALPLRTPHSGVFVPQQPGLIARLSKPADRETALREAGAAGGKLTLVVDSRMTDGSNVTVTISSQEQPEVRRKFTGRLQVDISANRLLLNLRSTQPPPPRPGTEAELRRIAHWTSMLLELRNDALCGIATAGPAGATTVFNVAFARAAPAPDAPKAARPRPAKRRNP